MSKQYCIEMQWLGAQFLEAVFQAPRLEMEEDTGPEDMLACCEALASLLDCQPLQCSMRWAQPGSCAMNKWARMSR